LPIIHKSFTPQKYTAIYCVDEEQEGMRLDQFIQIYMESFSRETIKKKISEGDITIAGRTPPHRPSVKVHFNDQITLVTKKTVHEDEYWNGKKLKLQTTPEIIFKDESLVVISKPAYMATHPTGKHLFNCATVFLEAEFEKKTHSIHRLDRETSGILLVGRDPKQAAQLTTEFEKSAVKKCYFFCAKKSLRYRSNEFTAEERLGASEEGLKRVYIDHYPKDSKDGKSAKTDFKVLYEKGDYAIGLAFPCTGRQHQIRVHAMVHGLELIGDKLYLGSFKMFQRFKDNIAAESDYEYMELPRHALHSMALNIMYKGEKRTFFSPIPKDLKAWIEKKIPLDLDSLEKQLKLEIENYFQSSLK